jgi:LacI family transcriptional regulator
MVTMTDVARQAGVSIATVSHVLNGTRYVRDETRRLVLDAIDQTGYVHNTIARSLVTANTRTVGLAISAMSNPYFMDLVHAIETEIRQAGYTLLLADTLDDPEEELRVIETLYQRRVDGILCAPSGDPHRRALNYLANHNLPTVLVDRLASDRFDQVGTENREATSQLVEHLAARGHRRVALLRGLEGLATTIERLDGYRLGLERSGLPYDTRLVGSGASEVEPACAAVHQLVALPEPPTGIVAANNRMTIGAMRALRELGLAVPQDIALVSFDDFEWADLFHPRLTVIAQPIHEMGARAVRLLLDRLAEPQQPPRTVQLTPQFIHRESCGCPSEN